MKYEEIITDPTWLKDIKAGIVEPEALASYLIRTVPVAKLAKLCANYIYDEQSIKPFVISKEEFEAHFRIRGFRWNNGQLEKENRGHYSKKV